jgi:sugar/nucleoside kinase (ribokinase family)
MTDRHKRYDIATVGNYTKDTIVNAAGTMHADGWGFNYAAHAAASLGFDVAAITRLASGDSHVLDVLRENGISVFATETPSSTLMRLEYPTDNPDERILKTAATAGTYTPEEVRDVDAKAFVISPSIRGEVPFEVFEELRLKDTTIGADIQGFIRIIGPDTRLLHTEWPERHQYLALVDVLKADIVEAESLTGETDLRMAARAMAAFGPREIVLTHRNGVLIHADGEFYEAEFHPVELVGRSGRGDTCLGSYMAARLKYPPAEAIRWSAAVTSLKMEANGPICRDYQEIVDLVERKYNGIRVMN